MTESSPPSPQRSAGSGSAQPLPVAYGTSILLDNVLERRLLHAACMLPAARCLLLEKLLWSVSIHTSQSTCIPEPRSIRRGCACAYAGTSTGAVPTRYRALAAVRALDKERKQQKVVIVEAGIVPPNPYPASTLHLDSPISPIRGTDRGGLV